MKTISTRLGILIIVAVAIVLFGGVFAYSWYANSKSETINPKQIQNSNTEIVDWKTYTNNEYGFEIKYPLGGTVLQIKEDELGNKTESPNQCTQISYESSFVYISLPPYNVNCGGTTGIGIDSIKLSEQINIEGKTYQAEGWKLGPNYESLSFKTDTGLHISYVIVEGLSSSDYKTSKELNYKMLSTFKFIK